MADTVKAWIEERRTIHAGGRDVLLRSSYELERESGIEEGADIDAIVDAHSALPCAMDALSAVLELHKPIGGFVGNPSHWECNVCADDRGPKPYPCPTVRALGSALLGAGDESDDLV